MEKYINYWFQGLKKIEILEQAIVDEDKTALYLQESFRYHIPIHLIQVWSVENGICLGQTRSNTEDNEVIAIPQVLDLFDIEQTIVTVDAMDIQREIAQRIIRQKGDYIIAVKGNLGGLEEEVKIRCSRSLYINQGKMDTRHSQVFDKGTIVDTRNRWNDLLSVIKVTAIRENLDKTESQERYYISSLDEDNDFNKLIRDHWVVEDNSWKLDMAFLKTRQRKRNMTAIANFAVVKKIVFELLKNDNEKGSIKTKRLRAAVNRDFLIKVLKN